MSNQAFYANDKILIIHLTLIKRAFVINASNTRYLDMANRPGPYGAPQYGDQLP